RGVFNTGGGSTYEMYLNSDGYNWTSTTTYQGSIPQFAINGSFALTTGWFGDFNGDGLPDYGENVSGSYGQTNGAYLGNGSAWDATTTVLTAIKSVSPTPAQDNSQLIDINGDGLDDWVWSDASETYVQLNNGTGWESAEPAFTLSTTTLY